jgi:hypothetical protein
MRFLDYKCCYTTPSLFLTSCIQTSERSSMIANIESSPPAKSFRDFVKFLMFNVESPPLCAPLGSLRSIDNFYFSFISSIISSLILSRSDMSLFDINLPFSSLPIKFLWLNIWLIPFNTSGEYCRLISICNMSRIWRP